MKNQFFSARLVDLFRSSQNAGQKNKAPKSRGLRLEELEDRRLLSVAPWDGTSVVEDEAVVVGEALGAGNCAVVVGVDCESAGIDEASEIGEQPLVTGVTYNANDLAAVESLGLTATSSQVKWDASGRLIELQCGNCLDSSITTVDLTGCDALQVLVCSSNGIQELILTGCASLVTLGCHENQLTTLDVSCCPSLEILSCRQNQLTTLNVSGCASLRHIDGFSNQLTTLDLSSCISLSYLTCYRNQLTTLNVSGCTSLETLLCFSNQLTTLDVSNCANLIRLDCYLNQLTTLDLSNCTSLKILNRDGLILQSLKLSNEQSQSIKVGVYASGWNKLAVITNGSSEYATKDSSLYCFTIAPTEVNGENIIAPITLVYYNDDNQIGSSWINSLETLSTPSLQINANEITADSVGIVIGEVTSATRYTVEYSTSSTFESSSSKTFDIAGEQTFTGLDPATTYYVRVKASATGFDDSDWSTIEIEALTNLATPTIALKSKTDVSLIITIGAVAQGANYVLEYSTNELFSSAESIVCQPGDVTISGLSEATTYYFRVKATATGHDESGWSSPFEARTIVSYNSSDLAVVQGFGLTATSEGVVWNDEGRLAELTLADSALTNVEIQNCTALTKLDVSRCANLELLKCPNNNLEELLFTGCDNLKYLWCRNNNLCELDVSGFGKLRGLNCKNNKLTLLNVSNCAMLSYIECDDNNLTDLSITCCENLARIECHNNSLTDLNLSGLDNLVVIECHGNSLTELDVSNCVNLVSLYIDYSVRKLTLSEERESIGSLYVRTCEDWDSIEVSVVSGSQPIIGRIDTGGYVYRTVRGLNTATDPITITYRKNGGLVGTTSINDIEQLANPEVSVGAIATDSVVFDFGEVENATSYVVEYSTNSDFADSSTATFATFGAATISDLLPGTRYYFRVKVTATGFGDSDWTTLEATTLADAGGLTLVGATSNAIVLAIGEVEGATGYVVEYGTDPEFGSFETETFATFGNATIFGLSAATTYYLRVKATAPEWDGIWSTRIVAATSLATPTIELKTKTTNSITLTLGAVAQGINYVLEYATDESFTSTATKVCQSGDVTVTGLSNATAYYFRVKATSTEYEESEWSSPFEARTVVTYNADDLAIIEGFGLTATSDGVVWNDEGRLVELTIVDSWRMVVEIECDSLKKLDLNGCANLRTIKCSCVNLTELNFSQCEKLSNLICPNNKLTKLEISDKVEFFFSLVIYNTNIKYLDLTNIKANCLELIIANDIPYIWVPNDLFALSLCSDKAEGVYYTDAYDSVVRSDGNGNTVPFMKGYPTMWGGHFNSFPSSFVITFLKNGEPVGTTVINGPRVLDSPTVALVSATDAEVVLDIAEVENAANYIVEYSDDPNFADFSTATFATPGLATITGLLPTTTYYFRVKATSTGFDDSPWSTVGVEATTILAIPTIALKSKTDVSVTLTIGEVARGTNYVLEYGTDESFASATSIACQPGDVTISGLSEATTYYFRIRVTAFGYAASEWSSPFDARTASYYDEDDLAFLESVGLTATSEGVYWNESRRLYHVLIKNGNYESIVVPTSCDALETIVFSDASDANVKCQKLDVSGCVALHTIYCERIDLNELDVSGCGNLKYLFCYDNNLTSLDVSNCPELVILECQGNSFQSLDLSNCPNLKLFYFDSSLKTVSMDRSSINEFNVYQTNEWDSVSVVDGNGSSYSYTNRFTSWSEYSSSYRIIYRWTNLDTATDPITFSYFKNGELVGTTVINGMEQLDSPSAEVVSATSDEVVLDVGEVEDATSYVVEYSTNSDFADSSSATFATFGNATISDLLPGTRYYFRIKATARGYGDSEWTSLQETTLSESQEPTLVEATSDAIVLAICEIVNATSYVVEYGTDPEFDSFETETFATFGNATISGLSAATTYYFRVKATSSGWIYPWSTIIAATTKLATPSLQIKANVKTAYSVGLTIGEVMGAEGYSVEWSTSPAFASVSSKTFDGFGEKTITGLSPATIYYFRVKATSTLFGASAPSAEVVATTNLATPSIAVKNQTVDSITLTIGSVNQGENYAIEYSTSESFESALAIVRQPGDSTISGLQAATLYYFRVKATATGFDASAWSTPVVAITDARAPTLAYKSKTDNSIEVAIGAIDDATSYILEYSTSSDFASNAVFVTYGEPGDKTITDLVPSATYYFRVRSILSDGIESSWSSSVAIATNLATPFLAIDYRTKTVNSIVLTISPTLVDNVNRATSYSIEYSKDPTFALGGGEATLATSGTSAVTALISHLDPATTYYFRVKATSEIWDDSAWSSATSATTNLASPALLCKSTSGNSATLVIGAVDRATNYAVEYSTDPTFGSSSTKTFSVSQIAESAEQTISGLIPSTPYYFRVKATANGFDDSSWSSVVDARTGVAIPSLSYGSKTASTISLSLNDVGYWENENYELWYWEVAYPGVRTQITASTPSLLVNRLQPATTYTFRVRTIAEDATT